MIGQPVAQATCNDTLTDAQTRKKTDHNQPGTSHSRSLTQATMTSFVSNMKPISTSCKEEIANGISLRFEKQWLM